MVELTQRSLEPELLDIERPAPDRLERFYRFLEFVNAFLGGTRAVRRTLEQFSKRWTKDQTFWILDVASGSADVPRALVCWARRRGYALKIVALDREEDTLEFARRRLKKYPEILLVQGRVETLPFREECFDYVISNLFFHHLQEEEVLQAIGRFDRLARRGVVINDLLRKQRLYWWTGLLSLFCEPLLRHDNLLSVRKAFTLSEIEALRRQAGLRYLHLHTTFGHRFVLAGEKGSS